MVYVLLAGTQTEVGISSCLPFRSVEKGQHWDPALLVLGGWVEGAGGTKRGALGEQVAATRKAGGEPRDPGGVSTPCRPGRVEANQPRPSPPHVSSANETDSLAAHTERRFHQQKLHACFRWAALKRTACSSQPLDCKCGRRTTRRKRKKKHTLTSRLLPAVLRPGAEPSRSNPPAQRNATVLWSTCKSSVWTVSVHCQYSHLTLIR